MAFILGPSCGGVKLNDASFKKIGRVVTDVNATAIAGDVFTTCGQPFDGAYFTNVGHTVALAGAKTVTGNLVSNCCLPFDSGSFAMATDGSIEYNPDIMGLLTITTSPTDAIILVVDSNDMPVLDHPDAPGVFPVLVGGNYTYTVTKTGYVTQTASIEISDAVEEVAVTLELAELTMNVTPTDATVVITDSQGTAVVGVDNVYPVAIGSTYTYSVSKTGYTTQTSTVAITQDAQTVTVVLVEEP